MKNQKVEFVEELLSASDYRQFMKVACKKAPHPISYSLLTKRAGFSSRSYVRDVIEGDRRITPRAISKFSQGLGLSGEWKRYFRLLVALKEPDAIPEGWTPEKLVHSYEHVRNKIRLGRIRRSIRSGEVLSKATRSSHLDLQTGKSLLERILKIPHFLKIYPALGIANVGVEFKQVIKRCGLEQAVLENALLEMEELELLSWDRSSDWIYPKDFHLSFTEESQTELSRSLFQQSLKNAEKETELHFRSPEKLFQLSSFCVKRSRLTRLKNELREILLKYVDQNIDENGDQVVTLVTSFY